MGSTPHQVRALQELTEMAMTTAAAVALGNMRLLELPNGGSISLSLLPILALAVRRGARPAAIAGAASGIVHVATGGVVVHPVQLLLDYGLGAMAPAVAALAHRRRQLLAVGVVCAALAQYLCYVVSGAVFFAVAGSGAWAFSAMYNATIVAPELVIALFAVPVLVRALDRADPPRAPHNPAQRSHIIHSGAASPPRPLIVQMNTPSPGVHGPHYPAPVRAQQSVPRPDVPTTRPTHRIDRRPPAFTGSHFENASSGTSPSAWQTMPPQRGFAR